MNIRIFALLSLFCADNILGSAQPNFGIPNLQGLTGAIGNSPPSINNLASIGQQINGGAANNALSSATNLTNSLGQQLNGATGGQASGVINQATSSINNQTSTAIAGTQNTPPNSPPGGGKNSAPGDEPTKQTALEAIEGALTGVDPTSIDAERAVPNMDPNSGTAGGSNTPPPNLELLWKCKRDSSMNKALCAVAIQNFCSGRCTRLNCMVPTNYVTCTDICGEKATMMQPCVDAGKLNVGPAQIMNVQGAFDPSAPPPPPPEPAADPNAAAGAPGQDQNAAMAAMMQQQQQMAMMGMGLGLAGAGAGAAAKGVGAAAKGVGSAAKGIGSLFKRK